jgi:hypothetical protein
VYNGSTASRQLIFECGVATSFSCACGFVPRDAAQGAVHDVRVFTQNMFFSIFFQSHFYFFWGRKALHVQSPCRDKPRMLLMLTTWLLVLLACVRWRSSPSFEYNKHSSAPYCDTLHPYICDGIWLLCTMRVQNIVTGANPCQQLPYQPRHIIIDCRFLVQSYPIDALHWLSGRDRIPYLSYYGALG